SGMTVLCRDYSTSAKLISVKLDMQSDPIGTITVGSAQTITYVGNDGVYSLSAQYVGNDLVLFTELNPGWDFTGTVNTVERTMSFEMQVSNGKKNVGHYNVSIGDLTAKVKVSIVNQTTGKTLYNKSVKGDALLKDFNFDEGNYSITVTYDDKGKASPATDFTVSVDCTAQYAVTLNDDTMALAKANGSIFPVNTLNTVMVSGYVGSCDLQDYYYINVETAGAYSLEVLMAESAIDGKNQKLKLSIFDANGKKIYNGTFADGKSTVKNLDAGEYYIMVNANGNKLDSNYAVDVTRVTYLGASHLDDTAQGALDCGRSVTVNGVTAADYVGFGDGLDFIALDGITGTADYKLMLLNDADSGTTASGLKFHLVVVNDDDYATPELLETAKIKNGVATFKNFYTFNESSRYFVAVEAGGSSRKNAATYTVSFEQYNAVVPAEMISAADNEWTGANLLDSAQDNWIGLGDAVDWFKFAVDESGSYNLNIGLQVGTKFKAEIYSALDGELKKVGNLTVDDLTDFKSLKLSADTDYYVKLFTTDDEKHNSRYTIALGDKLA
ncbi:MAG: hypothetical protein PHQ27_08550, partial [Victivallales bacterium]|nr:hypothetical protein [Victivallales bacterium]